MPADFRRRGENGPPMIIPPDGGRAVVYSRPSNFGKVLQDTYFLEKYSQRLIVKGVATTPDLLAAAIRTPLEDKQTLNKVCEQAYEAAGGSEKSRKGTWIHGLTENVDRGEPLPGNVPAEYLALLDNYRAVAAQFHMEYIECALVNDEIRAAGTADRLGVPVFLDSPDGQLYVLDIKSGDSAAFFDEHAAQLAIYSRSSLYSVETGERTPLDLNQEVGYLLHVPQSGGECGIYEVDLKQGWDAVLLAVDVREWRKKRGMVKSLGAA